MTRQKTTNTPDILDEILAFQRERLTLILATTNAFGEPLSSYAPFIEDETGCFCIFVSELAGHTANLARNAPVSILFIEDEASSSQLFARKRVTYSGTPAEVQRGTTEFEYLIDQMAKKHGQIVEVLRNLEDFHLFRISPQQGIYVRGFGEAFRIGGEALREIDHLREKGHRSEPSPSI